MYVIDEQYDFYLVIVVQVRLWWRRGILPEKLSTIGQRVWLKGLRCRRRLILLAGRRLSLMKNDVCWMHTVAVLLTLPQFTTNKTNCNHSAVTAHHFIFGAPFCKTEDSYFEAVC